MTVTDYNDGAVRAVCYDCGSPVAKRSYNYFRRMNYESADKVWCRVYIDNGEPVGFYYAARCVKHVRLIEIAVRSERQGIGLGRLILADLSDRSRAAGIHAITFRTPIAEKAIGFWQHVGARVLDVKGSDYEMILQV